LEVDERRAQLLELGLRVFSERAYDDVSIDDIARAAGVSKGLLYHYFSTKRDFYIAGLEVASAQLLRGTLTPRDLAPEERMRRGLETYLDFVQKHGKAYVALVSGGVGSDPEVARILERTRRTFVRRILEDVPAGFVTPLVRVALRGWIGFVEATAVEWMARRDLSRRKVVDLLGRMLLDAMQIAAGQPLPLARA
jgi:AcrR family transcriptional regulator